MSVRSPHAVRWSALTHRAFVAPQAQRTSQRASELEEQTLCILAAAASLPIGTRRRPEFRYPSGAGESSEERERERERETKAEKRATRKFCGPAEVGCGERTGLRGGSSSVGVFPSRRWRKMQLLLLPRRPGL